MPLPVQPECDRVDHVTTSPFAAAIALHMSAVHRTQ
jgi:hypothetical protein